MFFSDYFFRLGFKSVQNDFQHDFAKMTNEADGSVFLTERSARLPCLGCIIISN